MPLPKPTTRPNWTYGNPNFGVVTQEPSSGKKLNGWDAGERPPREFVNWVFWILSQWLDYFESVTDEEQDETVTTITFAQSPYTALSTDDVILVDASTNTVTVNLPSAVGLVGHKFTIKKNDSTSNFVTIDASGSQTIDGELTQDLGDQYSSLTMISDNANWSII